MSNKEIDKNKPSQSPYSKKNPRIPDRKPQEVDQEYLDRNPGYKPGVWMRNPSSLSNMEKDERDKQSGTLSQESQDRIINEEIERYINDYNREKKESTKDLKEKIENDIRRREKLLEELIRRDEEASQPQTSKRPDLEEEKRNIDKIHQQIIEERLEKQRQMDRERQKMNELIKRKVEGQDRLLDLQRRELEEIDKKLFDVERVKNEIERNRLQDLKKQREELLKQEMNELTEIEKHEKKKRLIEEELRRSIKEREAEKERFSELNKKIEELRQRELEELARIQSKEGEVSRRRKELLDDDYRNKMQEDVIEVWPCDGNNPRMCIVEPDDLCVDPFSGKLAIKGDFIPVRDSKSKDNQPRNDVPVRPKKGSADVRKPDGKKTMDKRKYLELLSTYDPKKLRRKLSYQNWLINDTALDDRQIAQKFPGSDFSLEIDMNDWPAIKQESMKQYAALKTNKGTFS